MAERTATPSKTLSGGTAQAPAPAQTLHLDWIGFGIAILGSVLFSTKGVFIKLAYAEGATADQVVALRMIVAVPIYLAIAGVAIARGRTVGLSLTPRTIVAACGIGALGYFLASYLDFLGLEFVTAQYERLVLLTYPFFTLALGVWFFGDKMRWSVIPAMGLSYLGIVTLFGWNLAVNPDGLIEGTLLVLAAGLVFALYQHLAKRSMTHLGTLMFTCIAMTSAGAVAIVYSGARGSLDDLTGLTANAYLYGLALGVVGTVLPSFFLNNAISRIGARATATMGNFGTVATIFLAVTILGEAFTVYHAAGTALVIAGAIWFSRAERRPRTPKPPSL